MIAYAGVDLGGTNLRGVVVDRQGEILAQDRRAVGESRAPDAVCRVMAELVHELREQVGIEALAGVGVGAAAWIDRRTGWVRRAPNLGWVDVDLQGALGAALGPGSPPPELVNDLTAVTYGEWRAAAGAGSGVDDLLCVFVGSGLGSGMVLGGRLYEGASGVAGELGHVTVVDGAQGGSGARECGCGRRGCVEAYVGGRYLEARVCGEIVEESGAAYALAIQASHDRGAGGTVTCTDIEAGYRAGDSDCRALWDEAAEHLGQAVAIGVQLLDPAVVVLGGGVMDAAPSYRRLAVEAFERRCPAGLRAGLRVRPAALGGASGAIGAALLARDRRVAAT